MKYFIIALILLNLSLSQYIHANNGETCDSVLVKVGPHSSDSEIDYLALKLVGGFNAVVVGCDHYIRVLFNSYKVAIVSKNNTSTLSGSTYLFNSEIQKALENTQNGDHVIFSDFNLSINKEIINYTATIDLKVVRPKRLAGQIDTIYYTDPTTGAVKIHIEK